MACSICGCSLEGDLNVDAHHTVEDVGICLGQTLREALGDHRGLRRTADVAVPMDEALAHVAVDCGGRSYYVQRDPFCAPAVGRLETDLVRHFFDSLAREARINIHVITLYGVNAHHQVEAVFKAFARALDAATRIDERLAGRLAVNEGAHRGGSIGHRMYRRQRADRSLRVS